MFTGIIKDIGKISSLDNKKGDLTISVKTNLSLDSHNTLPVNVNDVILIDKNPGLLTLIHPRDHDFFSSCRNKLGWSIGIDRKSIRDS